jgi:hypothetical protein
MTTNMIDSIHATCHNIPTGTRKVAGYATGTADIRWRRADWDRFNRRHTGLVRIDQSFGGRDPLGSDVLDVETGAATPGQVAHWVRTRHAAGKRFSDVYTNRSTFPAIAAALNAAGPQATFHRHVRLWLADWSLSRAQAARLLGTRLLATRSSPSSGRHHRPTRTRRCPAPASHSGRRTVTCPSLWTTGTVTVDERIAGASQLPLTPPPVPRRPTARRRVAEHRQLDSAAAGRTALAKWQPERGPVRARF